MENNERDDIDSVFDDLQGRFDIEEPSTGHKDRFFIKLRQQQDVILLHPKKYNWRNIIAIAASLVFILGITSLNFISTPKTEAELASVSPEMLDTQNFFTVTIESQLEKIKGSSSPETKKLIIDAIQQLEVLESSYMVLKKDLVYSGNDRRVITAMIKNFQKRAALLDDVLIEIETIRNQKVLENENNIL